MKILITTVFFLYSAQLAFAYAKSTELELTESYISSINELNDTWIKFEKDFKKVKTTIDALKAIDDALKVYEKYEKSFQKYHSSENENISLATRKHCSLLYDLMRSSYQTMAMLAKDEYYEKNLKKDCKELLERNKKITLNAGYIALDFCSVLILKEAKENKQFSILTLKQRNDFNNLIESKFGESIIEGQKSKSDSGFEHSAKILYEFLNLEWVFVEN